MNETPQSLDNHDALLDGSGYFNHFAVHNFVLVGQNVLAEQLLPIQVYWMCPEPSIFHLHHFTHHEFKIEIGIDEEVVFLV